MPKQATKRNTINRRQLFQMGATAAATATLAGARGFSDPGPHDLIEVTIAELQARMAAGKLTALELVHQYRARIDAIDRHGPEVNSVLQLNPDAEDIAEALDEERHKHAPRGPLHGIPLLFKDNIDTHDRMHTTAGSLALLGSTPPLDATVAKRLRDAGMVLLGKLNMSEWANAARHTHRAAGVVAAGNV